MASPKLSILVATIETRKVQFAALSQELERQIKPFPPEWVEVLSICDDKTMILGEKRNRLLEMSKGDYVVFVDDDDWISPNYVKNILNAIIKDAPDCIGWLIGCEFMDIRGNVERTARAICSNKYNGWEENKDGFDITQFIYHKNPVKREIALAAKFPRERYAEDFEYGKRIKPMLQNETFINEVMYFYKYQPEPGGHKARYGIR